MKETSILSLWQRWNYVYHLIEKRSVTMRNIRHLSEEEITEELTKEFGNEYPTHWLDMIAKPLGEEICKAGGFDKVSVEGPFGIGSRVRLSFFKNGEDNPSADICVEPELSIKSVNNENSILTKIDYSTNTGEFKPGTVGSMNGLNFGRIEIDNEATASSILPLLDIIEKKETK